MIKPRKPGQADTSKFLNLIGHLKLTKAETHPSFIYEGLLGVQVLLLMICNRI